MRVYKDLIHERGEEGGTVKQWSHSRLRKWCCLVTCSLEPNSRFQARNDDLRALCCGIRNIHTDMAFKLYMLSFKKFLFNVVKDFAHKLLEVRTVKEKIFLENIVTDDAWSERKLSNCRLLSEPLL